MRAASDGAALGFGQLEQLRTELTAYCYRMLGSPFDAEDAVQDAFVHALRGSGPFPTHSAIRPWLYRIATNVCLDLLRRQKRRLWPADLGPPGRPVESNLHLRAEAAWLEPIPVSLIAGNDPAEAAIAKESIRLAFVAMLQHLPPKQRAVLILHDVLDWRASEIGELLRTSTAAVNSALQRARVTTARKRALPQENVRPLTGRDRAMLERYVSAFELYDLDALTALIREDAHMSMPPFDMWLAGRDDLLAWLFGPGIACRGSRVIPCISANCMPTFGQYKPGSDGGFEPWALQVLEPSGGRILELTFFLNTARLFPIFGLPAHLD